MAEMVVLNQARSLATLSFLAAQTSLKTQAWRSVAGQIAAPSATVAVGTPLTFTLQAPGVDLSNARIVWEGTDQQPTFAAQLVFTPKRNGAQWVEAEAHLPDGRRVFAKAAFNADSPNTVWTDDAVPAGAVTGGEGGDSWNNWVSNNPIPSSGTQAHQSALSSGFHQHYFDNATTTLSVGTGDVLYAYVYLDPVNPPTEVMLQWNDGTWLHRAYWGADQIAFGVNGTASRRYMGPLPSTGRWVRLEVPANKVNLEGRVVKGMAFSLFNGRATWDAAGRMTQGSGTPTQITVPGVSLKVVNGYPIVTWPSTAGSTYRVAYKNDLRDASWTTASVDITATGTSALWVDTTPSRPSRRFYVVTRVQ
jgi:hypothetical protein